MENIGDDSNLLKHNQCDIYHEEYWQLFQAHKYPSIEELRVRLYNALIPQVPEGNPLYESMLENVIKVETVMLMSHGSYSYSQSRKAGIDAAAAFKEAMRLMDDTIRALDAGTFKESYAYHDIQNSLNFLEDISTPISARRIKMIKDLLTSKTETISDDTRKKLEGMLQSNLPKN